MTYDFLMPDIGEGVTEGEVLKWMVKEGDKISEDQPVVEIMTDKVNVQIPAPRGGTVLKVAVKEGEVAKVGQTILVIDDGSGPSASAPSSSVPPVEEMQVPPPPTTGAPQPGPSVLATPATRKLAREMGVEISALRGSGPQGRITDDDVRRAAARPRAVAVQAQPSKAGEREELVPLKGLRRTIAERMVKSKTATAQVTHVDEVDMTELVLLREAFKGSAEKRGVHLTYLPFMIKVLVAALKEFPYLNAMLDEQGGNIVLKKYYNIGVATDTEQGLVVPVVKEVDTKDIFELAGEIEKLAAKARSGQLSLDEVKGSTFTITNVGAIGGLFATPIINYPEVAILGLHKIAKRPVVRDGQVQVRDITYLSLSFDHRVTDGAYAARFTSRVIEIIQDTKKLLSEVL